MKRLILLFILLAAPPSLSFAQDDCGNGLPCGPVPWELPELPPLVSPTPIPTSEFSGDADPGDTPTPTPTFTPTVTPTGFVDPDDINDAVGTVSAIAAGTPIEWLDGEGQPIDAFEEIDDLALTAGTFFDYVATVSEANIFGPFTPMIAFILLALVITMIIKSLTFIVPVLAAVFGFIRKIVTLVLDFLPF